MQLITFPPHLVDFRKYISQICGSNMFWPCGPTDKASDYESGDCRFESCQGQLFVSPTDYHLLLARHLLGICNIGINISRVKIKKNCYAPPGGLEPPTFRLTAERASRLRHGGCAGPPINLATSALSMGMADAGFPHSLGTCTLYYYHHSPTNSASVMV